MTFKRRSLQTLSLLLHVAAAGCEQRGIKHVRMGSVGRAAGDDRPGTFRAAAIQAVSRFAAPAANRDHLARLVRRAAAGGASVVVLPEAAITGYMSTDLVWTWRAGERPLGEGLRGRDPKRFAEPVPGPSTRRFGRLARELGIYLTVPLLEVDPRGRYFNTSVLVGPRGAILAHYRKLNPWPWPERSWATRGDRGHAIVDTPLGRLALLICYDINFEPANLRRKGVDHLLYSIAWVDDEKSDWFAAGLPEVARRARFNIIGANWTVPERERPEWHGYGKSEIIGRDGRRLAKVDRDIGERIVYAELKVPERAR